MTYKPTLVQEIARKQTEPFVKGLEAGLEVIKQYEELGRSVIADDLSTESDPFHVATNRLAMSDDMPDSYGEAEFKVMGMGVISALEEAVVRSEGGKG